MAGLRLSMPKTLLDMSSCLAQMAFSPRHGLLLVSRCGCHLGTPDFLQPHWLVPWGTLQGGKVLLQPLRALVGHPRAAPMPYTPYASPAPCAADPRASGHPRWPGRCALPPSTGIGSWPETRASGSQPAACRGRNRWARSVA